MRDLEPSRLKKGCGNPRMLWCGFTQHRTGRKSCKSLSLDGKWKCSPACAPARHRAKCPCNPLQPQCDFNNMRRQLRIQSRDKVSARVGQLGGMPRHGRKGASLRARRRLQQRAQTTTAASLTCAKQPICGHLIGMVVFAGVQCGNIELLGHHVKLQEPRCSPSQRSSPTPLYNGFAWNRLRASSFRAETRRGGSSRRG